MAFLVGLAAVPMAGGVYWLLDTFLPERACKSDFLGCLGEVIVLGLVASLLAGVIAQLSAKRLEGWLLVVGGLLVGVAAVMVLSAGETGFWLAATNLVPLTAFVGVPASVAYLVTLGLRRAVVPVTLGLRGAVVHGETLPQPVGTLSAPGTGRYWDGTRWLDPQG